jgi:Ax21 family sulfation-dependent quorum factor
MKKTLIALALAAVLPLSAHAAEPAKGLSYSWLEGDYIDVNGGNGWGLRGSFDFGNSGLYGFGSWSKLDADEDDFDIDIDNDVDANEFGLGYHHPIADNTDLLVEGAYRNYDADVYRIDGARVSVGARSAMTDNFEGFVKANYYDMSDFDGDLTGTVGAQYKFNPTWGVTGEAEFGNGDEAYMLGLRASF